MTAPDMTTDLAGVRAQLADVAAEAARVAAEVGKLTEATELASLIASAVRLGYDQGHEDGRAERDPLAAEARARKARAEFRVLPGGKAPAKARKGTARAVPRKTSGGAA